MNHKHLKLAHQALHNWKIGLRNGDWTPYLNLLTDDYIFWVPENTIHFRPVSRKSPEKTFVPNSFIAKRLEFYDQEPSIISVGEYTIVFEFILFKGEERGCMALSFDIHDGKISACREYQCILSSFS